MTCCCTERGLEVPRFAASAAERVWPTPEPPGAGSLPYGRQFGILLATSAFERSRFAADAIACPKEATWRFETRSLAEWSVSRYDEAIIRLSHHPGNIDHNASRTLLESAASCPPRHWALSEFPVVIDLPKRDATYFRGTTAWGALSFPELRNIVETLIAGIQATNLPPRNRSGLTEHQGKL